MSCPLPKLEREWEGRRVRTLREIRSNGGNLIRRGRIVLVARSYGGLTLKTLRKPGAYITRVGKDAVELLPK